MKFTLSWLKDHLDTNKDLETIVDTLTNIGLEIESVQDKSKDFNDFSVAEVYCVKTPLKPWPQLGFQLAAVHTMRGYKGDVKLSYSSML